MSNNVIDINCDLGEGIGNEAAIMPFISSVNIACGFHAGSPISMQETVSLAKKHQVAIGAHPSYPDREHFGRRTMHLSANEIYAMVVYQAGAMAAICTAEKIKLHHIKLHGALYNQAAVDKIIAEAVVTAIKDFDTSLMVYGLAGSILISLAKAAGIRAVEEAFADRSYTPEGTLTSRSMPHAMLTEPAEVTAQALSIVLRNTVRATDHSILQLKAETLCIHGDGLHAQDFAKVIYNTMLENNIRIQSPA